MPADHEGVIHADAVYSTRALARIFGFKQARTIEEKLRERGVDVDAWGHGVVLVSGRTLQLAIERRAAGGDE